MNKESAPITAAELAELTVDAGRRELTSNDSLRLIAEIERLSHQVDHWKAEAARFEGLWRMECDLAASNAKEGGGSHIRLGMLEIPGLDGRPVPYVRGDDGQMHRARS